jgi:iron complex outermembrane receptor protein
LQGLYVNRRKDVPTASFSTLFNVNMENTTDEAAFYELKYDRLFENGLNIQSRLSYNWYRYKGDYPVHDLEVTPTFLGLNKELFDGQWWRAELEASKMIWEDHHLIVGGQYQDNFHQFQTNYDISTKVSSLADTYQWALFIQDDYSISDQLTFNAGVRYDYFSIFGSTVNPRLGLIYNRDENSAIKLLYGTAFRAPNQYELNFVGAGIVASNNLRPEKLETVELVLEHYFSPRLRAELNLFHTDIEDIIYLESLGDNQPQQYQNVGNIDSNGLELQLEQPINDGWQWRVSYSWQENRDKATGQRLSNSPEHMVKFNLIAPLWTDKLFLGYELQYMSGRKMAQPLDHVGDYVISNLTVFTQNWVKGLELSAGVYNLFDEQYFDPASDAHRQNGIEQDGLTFRIKTSINF